MESDIKVGDILMLKNGVTLEVYECDLNENCKCSKGECYYKKRKDLLCPLCNDSIGFFDGETKSKFIFIEKH